MFSIFHILITVTEIT